MTEDAAPRYSPLLLPILLACSAPTPTLDLPVGPPAAHALTRPLHAFLTPTPFGAEGELLCPWARGEAVADASIARWVAEKRLTWRVLDVRESTTFGGGPIAGARALSDAITTLEASCDAEIPRDYLVAAGRDVRTGKVFTGLYALGKERFDAPWILVDDPAPGNDATVDAPRSVAPEVVKEEPPPFRPAQPSRLLEALGHGGDQRGDGSVAPSAWWTLVTRDPPQAIASDGRPPVTVDEALALRPETVVVAAGDDAAWSATIQLVDRAQGAGSGTFLAKLVDDADRSPSGPSEAARPATAAPTAPRYLHDPLPVLPIQTPTYRAPEAMLRGSEAPDDVSDILGE